MKLKQKQKEEQKALEQMKVKAGQKGPLGTDISKNNLMTG
jgi:hypothetical protein